MARFKFFCRLPRWRLPRAPFPSPTFELVQPQPTGETRCVPEDPACRTVRDGTTGWIGRTWIVIRELPPPPRSDPAAA